MELQKNYHVFKKLNAEIIAVAQEESDPAAMTRVENFVKSEFPVVVDPGKLTHELIKRYGVYLVDKQGIIRVFLQGTKGARPRLDLILNQLARIENVTPPKIKNVERKILVEKEPGKTSEGKAGKKDKNPGAIQLRWMWSHDIVRPGDEFKFAFCPVITEGFHVYGAGETQMTPFRVEFQWPEGIALTGKVTYPRAKIIDDPVLKMKLAVYEKDIPISTLNLKASDTLKPSQLTVTVVVTYQACDDTTCLPPTKIKKQFKLRVKEKEKKRQEVFGWKTW